MLVNLVQGLNVKVFYLLLLFKSTYNHFAFNPLVTNQH